MEAEVLQSPQVDHKFAVFVLYNGIKRTFNVVSTETVQALLNAALREFGITVAPHTYALYAVGSSTELPTNSSLKDAGVKPDEELILRPRAVAGG